MSATAGGMRPWTLADDYALLRRASELSIRVEARVREVGKRLSLLETQCAQSDLAQKLPCIVGTASFKRDPYVGLCDDTLIGRVTQQSHSTPQSRQRAPSPNPAGCYDAKSDQKTDISSIPNAPPIGSVQLDQKGIRDAEHCIRLAGKESNMELNQGSAGADSLTNPSVNAEQSSELYESYPFASVDMFESQGHSPRGVSENARDDSKNIDESSAIENQSERLDSRTSKKSVRREASLVGSLLLKEGDQDDDGDDLFSSASIFSKSNLFERDSEARVDLIVHRSIAEDNEDDEDAVDLFTTPNSEKQRQNAQLTLNEHTSLDSRTELDQEEIDVVMDKHQDVEHEVPTKLPRRFEHLAHGHFKLDVRALLPSQLSNYRMNKSSMVEQIEGDLQHTSMDRPLFSSRRRQKITSSHDGRRFHDEAVLSDVFVEEKSDTEKITFSSSISEFIFGEDSDQDDLFGPISKNNTV